MSEDQSEEGLLYSENDNFVKLEAEYNAVLGEMVEDPTLSPYVEVFTELFEAAYQQRMGAIECAETIDRLQDAIGQSRDQLTKATARIATNAVEMQALSDEVRTLHERVDAVHAREQEAHETIDNMRNTLHRLEEEREYNRVMAEEEEDERPTATRLRSSAQRECELLQAQAAVLHEQVETTYHKQEELEQITDDGYVNIAQLGGKLDDVTLHMNRLRNDRASLERQLCEADTVYAEAATEAQECTAIVRQDRLRIHLLNATLQERMLRAGQCYADLATWSRKYSVLQMEYNAALETLLHLGMRASALRQEMRMDERAARLTNAQLDHMTATKEGAVRRRQRMQAAIKRESRRRADLLNKIIHLDINGERARLMMYRRKLAVLMRTRNTIMINMKKQRELNATTGDQIALRDLQTQSLQADIEAVAAESVKNQVQQRYLAAEKAQLVAASADFQSRQELLVDELNTGKVALFYEKKILSRRQLAVRLADNQIEAQRSDMEVMRAQLRANNDANITLADSLRSLNIRLTELVRHAHYVDTKMIVCGSEQKRFGGEAERLRKRLAETKNEIHSLRAHQNDMRANIANSLAVIESHERQLMRQRELIDMLSNEVSTLGMQLQHRDDELVLLADMMTMLQAKTAFASTCYDQRIEDVRVLRLKIKQVLQEKAMLVLDVRSLPDFRAEVYCLEKDLLQLRIKVKNQEGELRRPLNVHRWRQLEMAIPEAYMMIQRAGFMQKKRVVLVRQLEERMTLKREAETLYTAMRRRLSMMPDPVKFMETFSVNKGHLAQNRVLERNIRRQLRDAEFVNAQLNNELAAAARVLTEERCKLSQVRKVRWKSIEKLRSLKTHDA